MERLSIFFLLLTTLIYSVCYKQVINNNTSSKIPPPPPTTTTTTTMISPLLNTAFLFVLVTISSNVGTPAAERQFVRRPDSERELPPINHRKLETDTDGAEITFTRSYTAVTAPKDITFVNPPNIQGVLTIQGSYFITYAGVFRTSSIELVPTKIGVGDPLFWNDSQDQLVLQPKTIPSIDDDFTIGGKCTTTNGKTLTQIISHSCFYDLCLGSPTDCVNIYAGTRFNFSPIKDSSNRAYFVGLQNDGNLDPEEGVSRNKGSKGYGGYSNYDDDYSRSLRTKSKNRSKNAAGPRKLQNQLVGPFEGFGSFSEIDLAKNGRFPLPPSFPGFCIGGTGRYHGIKCSFDLITVAQRSAFPTTISTSTPTSSPTLTDEPTDNRNNNRDLGGKGSKGGKSGGDKSGRQRERKLGGGYYEYNDGYNDGYGWEDDDQGLGRDDYPDDGVIVQKIFITSDQRLPLGPKAI